MAHHPPEPSSISGWELVLLWIVVLVLVLFWIASPMPLHTGGDFASPVSTSVDAERP